MSSGDWFEQCHSVILSEAKNPETGSNNVILSEAKNPETGSNNVILSEAKNPERDNKKSWLEICQNWKKKYPVVTEAQKAENVPANPYAVFDIISRALPEGITTITSNGTCCVAGHQSWVIKSGSRFLNNNAVASMGYGLPAAVGAAVAERTMQGAGTGNTKSDKTDEKRTALDEADKKLMSADGNDLGSSTSEYGHPYVVCLEGDGSIMMNLQELQTISTNRLPVKIFLINNEGYHSIRQTQTNLFGDHTKVGIGPESGDLSFPDFGKLAQAFGLPYARVSGNREMEAKIGEILSMDGPVLCEVIVNTKQNFEPKSSARRLEDGTLVSPPLEDLAPFLPREELAENMFIE